MVCMFGEKESLLFTALGHARSFKVNVCVFSALLQKDDSLVAATVIKMLRTGSMDL
jgi:hypothetical protein